MTPPSKTARDIKQVCLIAVSGCMVLSPIGISICILQNFQNQAIAARPLLAQGAPPSATPAPTPSVPAIVRPSIIPAPTPSVPAIVRPSISPAPTPSVPAIVRPSVSPAPTPSIPAIVRPGTLGK